MNMRYESERLTAACQRALSHAKADDAETLRTCRDEGSLSISDIRLLSRVLRGATDCTQESVPSVNPDPVWVHQLMEGARPLLPARAAKPAPHPDLEPRLRKLRAAQEDREYAKMVGSLAGSSDEAARDEAEMNTYRSQISVGLNLIVSMATMFVVGCYGGGTEEEPMGVRAVVCGLALMILTLAIEMALFLIGATRVDAKVYKRERAAQGRGLMDRTRLSHVYSKVNEGPSMPSQRRP